MTQAELIDLDLVDKVVAHIPTDKWDQVRQAVVERIIDNMPGTIIQKITGSYDDFDKAEQTLNNFYANETNELIVDAFRIIGLEETIYLLDSLQLTEDVPASHPAPVPELQGEGAENN